MYQFQCNLCMTLHARPLDDHNSTLSSESKHHADNIPDELLSCFKAAQVLKKYWNKFYCLVKEMLYMEQLRRPHWDCVIGFNTCCLSLCLAFLFFKMQIKSSFKSFLTRIYSPPPKKNKNNNNSHTINLV